MRKMKITLTIRKRGETQRKIRRRRGERHTTGTAIRPRIMKATTISRASVMAYCALGCVTEPDSGGPGTDWIGPESETMSFGSAGLETSVAG